ncbi:MAG TPA: nucleotidyltransferase domain-containing protein [Phycisphaerales bacterium]|nr:nucleotidyltransferase domain-containing protein [Phycisphaerales bacterium]
MNDIHHRAARSFIRESGYAADERVRAIFLIGSSASGEDDAYSDIDMLMVVSEPISDEERLATLQRIGCRKIMLAIAGVDNPAFPVASQVIDKFVYRGVWFDVSCHLPHQMGFCFDHEPLIDKDDLTAQLCRPDETVYTDEEMMERVRANLRLLHARIYRYDKYLRRREWVGLDLKVIKNLIVDVMMVWNERPNYNRHASRPTHMLRSLAVKPPEFEQTFLDILHLDNRIHGPYKLGLLREMEGQLIALYEERWGPMQMYDDQT